MRCEVCGIQGERVYEWANVSGKYLRSLEDFIQLCQTCHRRYDKGNFEKRKKITEQINIRLKELRGEMMETGARDDGHGKE